jgi:N-formylglutamate deformylase
MERLPLLLSIPHGASEVPDDVFQEMLGCGQDAAALRQRILQQGDPFTDDLFSLPNVTHILRAPYSRFVADLNRARYEDGENGILKLCDFDRKPLYAEGYRISKTIREHRLQNYYDPYHSKMEAMIKNPEILGFIDGHSMSAEGPNLGPDLGIARPAMCIGNFGDAEGNFVNTPLSFSAEGVRLLRDYADEIFGDFLLQQHLPRSILLNQPFDGGYILEKYSNPKAEFHKRGLMLEINRALYLDEKTLLPIPGRMSTLRKGLSLFATKMCDWLQQNKN